MNGNWVREPLKTYANYSPELILGWLLGTPLIAGIIILTLVRQLNRPLRRLQNAANSYSKMALLLIWILIMVRWKSVR